MKKIILYLLLLLLITSMIFTNTTITSSQNAITLWTSTLVPSFLFPFIFIRLLMPYHLLTPLLKPLEKLFLFLFNMNTGAIELIISALFLGFPGASLLIEEYANKNHLKSKSYHRLLGSAFMASPSFILLSLNTIYPSHLTHKLLYVQLLSILMLLLCTRSIPIYINNCIQYIPFSKQMKIAIQSSIQILLMILSYLLIVFVTTDLLLYFIPFPIVNSTIKLLSEFSSACFYIPSLSFNIKNSILLTSILLSYGGLCVHLQIISALESPYFQYSIFLKYRITHILLSFLFASLFF